MQIAVVGTDTQENFLKFQKAVEALPESEKEQLMLAIDTKDPGAVPALNELAIQVGMDLRFEEHEEPEKSDPYARFAVSSLLRTANHMDDRRIQDIEQRIKAGIDLAISIVMSSEKPISVGSLMAMMGNAATKAVPRAMQEHPSITIKQVKGKTYYFGPKAVWKKKRR